MNQIAIPVFPILNVLPPQEEVVTVKVANGVDVHQLKRKLENKLYKLEPLCRTINFPKPKRHVILKHFFSQSFKFILEALHGCGSIC